MSVDFLSDGLWPALKRAVRSSRQRSSMAVAYFGKGASRVLPLRRGSRLVVDASERAVTAGQTCPADLLGMVKGGVRVYSVPNLHAKVFVLGRAAFIGSSNVSRRSADVLVEAAVVTRDRKAVQAARAFVAAHCLHELTPELIKRLAKLYRPPLVPGGGRKKRRMGAARADPTLPRVHLAQLELREWSDEEQAIHDAGLKRARSLRKHPRTSTLTSYSCPGWTSCQRGDVVFQVVNEGGGRFLVDPQANVLNVRTRKTSSGRVSFVYLEHAVRRRRDVKRLAKQIGHGAGKKLRRDGLVRNAAFARALLNAWSIQA